MYVSNATGSPIIVKYFLWAWHCLHMRACITILYCMESPAEKCGGGCVRSNTEVVIARRGGNIGGRFIDSG